MSWIDRRLCHSLTWNYVPADPGVWLFALISISSGDREMRALAVRINRQLQALREERLKLRHGDMELKAAVTNISHDLRTPLTAICGYLDLLEREPLPERPS